MTDINTPKASPKALAVPTEVPNPTAGPRGLILTTLAEFFQQADIVMAARVNPKGLDSPEAVVIALQLGAELGLPPMQSLQSIAVINGRPGVYGDCVMALVRASGKMENYTQDVQGEGDNRKAIVTTTREGVKYSQTFSWSDAKRAKLDQKDGPWKQYPDRMMMFRARNFLFRDVYADILRGFKTVEELEDTPPEKVANASVVGSAEPGGINTPKAPAAPRKPRGKNTAETVAAGLQAESDAADALAAGPPPESVEQAAARAAAEPTAAAQIKAVDDYVASVSPAPAAAPDPTASAEGDSVLAEVLRLMEAAEMSAQDVADAAFNLAITSERTQPAAMAVTELLTVKKKFGDLVRTSVAIKEARENSTKLTPARS